MLTLDTHFIRAPLSQAEALGIDVPALLQELEISPDVFEQANTLVHSHQYVRLIQRVWELSDDEYWGLSGVRCKPGHFALMVRYVLQFDTLQAVLSECCRFYNTTREEWAFSLDVGPEKTALNIDINTDFEAIDPYLVEFMLVCMHRFICWFSDTRIPLLETRFSYPEPRHCKSYQDLFPGKRSFSTPNNAIIFPTQHLSLPIVRDWAEVRVFLQEAPAGLMIMPSGDSSYSARIKSILLDTLGKHSTVPDFDRVAEQLSISSQTLRRKLKSESTSYQQIKDTVRRDIAIDKLVRERSSITEIGLQLGFVESSSFTRAFKQWTGVSPAEYRLNKS